MIKMNGLLHKLPVLRLGLLAGIALVLAACDATVPSKNPVKAPNKTSTTAKSAVPAAAKVSKTVAPTASQPAYVFKTPGFGNNEKIMYREPNGKHRVVDGTGLVSAPVLSADGRRVAYLKQTWGSSHNIHIKNLRTDKVQIFPVKDATRFGMAWSSDGRYFYYSAALNNEAGKPTGLRALNTYDVIAKKVVNSHQTPPPGRMSVSPNSRYIAYITRDQKQPNDPDAWILRMYDKQLNKYRQMGSSTDSKAVLGRILWNHKSTAFSIASFDLAANGQRQNVRMAKYSLDLKEIGQLQLTDIIYSPQHNPRFIKVKTWLSSKPQNGKVYGLTPLGK